MFRQNLIWISAVLGLGISGCGGSAAPETSQQAAALCQPSGDWIVSYSGGSEQCSAPGTDRVRIDVKDLEHPVHLVNADGTDQPITSTFDEVSCTVTADWQYSYEAGGEPQGSSDSLVLTFASATGGVGTLDHSAWWWCGMHGSATFDADAAPATP